MPVTSSFVAHDGVKIRYLDNQSAHPIGRPVVFVPGIVDSADDYAEVFDCFGDRRLLVVEMRGRGQSDSPPTGYSAQDQAGDVSAVIDHTDVGPFHLMTFSRGTTAGLEVASHRPAQVLSVSIGDYLAAEIGLPPALVETMWATTWRGRPNSERVFRHVLDRLQADSRSRELWSELAALGVPVLVARGSKGGVVDDEAERRYRHSVPGVEVITIAGADHDLFRPSRVAYPDAVLEFIGRRLPGT